MPDTISLCIPAYNSARTLPRLLASAEEQSVPFDEIVVCDDGSTDETVEIAQAHGARVIGNASNMGCSAAKDNALRAATGTWVHFHDDDDVLLPDFTKLAHSWIARADCPDVVLFDYEYREDVTGEWIARIGFDDAALRADPTRYAILHQINPFCGLYRRSRVIEAGGYAIERKLLFNEDVAFHCRLALTGLSFAAEKTPSLINYRRQGSMSGAEPLKCLRAHAEVMRMVASSVGERYAAEIAERLWAAATGLAAHGDWREADAALADALRLYAAIPAGNSPAFRALCRLFGARLAYRVREFLIRLGKPHLRKRYDLAPSAAGVGNCIV